MNLCDDGHDEVCYEGRKCPCCTALNDVRGMEKELEASDNKVQELQEQLEAQKE